MMARLQIGEVLLATTIGDVVLREVHLRKFASLPECEGALSVEGDRKVSPGPLRETPPRECEVGPRICESRGISAADAIYALLGLAKAGADRKREPWQAWKFLDPQVGIAAESYVSILSSWRCRSRGRGRSRMYERRLKGYAAIGYLIEQ